MDLERPFMMSLADTRASKLSIIDLFRDASSNDSSPLDYKLIQIQSQK